MLVLMLSVSGNSISVSVRVFRVHVRVGGRVMIRIRFMLRFRVRFRVRA